MPLSGLMLRISRSNRNNQILYSHCFIRKLTDASVLNCYVYLRYLVRWIEGRNIDHVLNAVVSCVHIIIVTDIFIYKCIPVGCVQ